MGWWAVSGVTIRPLWCVSAPWMVDDELWALIEPLLPPWPERSPGLRPLDDRLCLQGILLALFTGITWQQLPPEPGFGSGQTCWRRLCRWTEAGVFDQVHRVLLAELNAARRIDWTRACVDSSHVRAERGVPGLIRRSIAASRAANTT
ncbi:hypothetical protein GCM10010271_55470 [Streptomyces kurssanovii]|nr:hypothetical protein GCM10010271_55470 [Streptomyces kurssanovii]